MLCSKGILYGGDYLIFSRNSLGFIHTKIKQQKFSEEYHSLINSPLEHMKNQIYN